MSHPRTHSRHTHKAAAPSEQLTVAGISRHAQAFHARRRSSGSRLTAGTGLSAGLNAVAVTAAHTAGNTPA